MAEAKKATKTALMQNKNSFKFIGKVARAEKEHAYKEDIVQKGKNEGKLFRALKLGVLTSDNNEMQIGTYDVEPEKIFMWNSEMKKEDKSYKGTWFDYEEWIEREDELRDEGYAVLQTRIGLTTDANGKIESKGLPSYVASKELYNGLDNGDSVVVEGSIRYSTFTNGKGVEVEMKNYTIQKVFKIKDVDFEADDFEEVTYFEQQMVFVDAISEKKDKKVIVTGRIIDYKQDFYDTQFVLDYSDGNGGVDDGMVKLAESFIKKINFGDVIDVHGEALNRVILKEVEGEEVKDNLLASLGGKSKPAHANYVAKSYVSEMQIQGIDAWAKKVYKLEDFVKDELVAKDDKKDLSDELGGKRNKGKDKNPFELSEPIEIDDSDLPF